MIVETDDDTYTIDKGPPLTLTCSQGQLVISARPVVEAFNTVSKNWYDSHPDLPIHERKLQAWLETGLIDWLPLVSDETHNILRQKISDVAWSKPKENIGDSNIPSDMQLFQRRVNKHSLPAIATVQTRYREDWDLPKEVELVWRESVNDDCEPGIAINNIQEGYAGFEDGVYKTHDYREDTPGKQLRIVHKKSQQPLRNCREDDYFSDKTEQKAYLINVVGHHCICSTFELAEKAVQEYFDDSDIDADPYITELPLFSPSLPKEPTPKPVKKTLKKPVAKKTSPPAKEPTPTPPPTTKPRQESLITGCQHVIVRGSLKGQKCDKEVYKHLDYCRKHALSKHLLK